MPGYSDQADPLTESEIDRLRREHREEIDGLRSRRALDAGEPISDHVAEALHRVRKLEEKRDIEASNLAAYTDLARQQLELMQGSVGTSGELRPGLTETPHRVAKMWINELTSGYGVDIDGLFKTFDDHGDYNGMVLVKNVPVASQCEHHLVPFVGYAHVAYLPNERVVGLSKIARVVDAYSRRLQIQERLTSQIHDALERNLQPRGVMVVVTAEHMCMTLRGVQAPGTKTMTSAVSGLFRDTNEYARDEFFRLLRED